MPSEDLRAVDLAAERAMLGSMLIYDDGSAWMWAQESGASRDDFYRTSHGLIYDALARTFETCRSTDLANVARVLRETGDLDAAGGVAYLASLVDGMPRIATREWMGSQVVYLKRKARTRRIGAYARSLVKACDESHAGLDDDELSEHLAALDGLYREGASVRVLDAQAQVMTAMQADYERQQGNVGRFGIPAIDDLTDGIWPGRIYAVAARTSVGKTTFGCHVAAQHGRDQKGLLFCSMEMSAAEVIGRLARVGLKAPRAERRMAELADDYLAHYGTVSICDKASLTVRQIESLIVSEQRRRDLSTVVVDYFGLLKGSKGSKEYERLSDNATDLKEVAKNTRTGIVTLVQIARTHGEDGSEEVGLGSARGSGVIEEAADCGIGLRWLGACRPFSETQRQQWRDVLWCRLFKNRHGPISAGEAALRRDWKTLTLTPDDALKFPEDEYQQAKKSSQKGGY